jgi:transcriptional regulator with XRE-family HTH domain
MVPPPSSLQGYFVAVTDKGFYLALGQRIAAARKARDLTQQQLADELGIAQQTYAHYEAGRLRVAVALLPPLARALDVSIEHLIGEDEPRSVSRRGPASRLQQQITRIQQLPRARQRFLIELIETTLQQAGNPPTGSTHGG